MKTVLLLIAVLSLAAFGCDIPKPVGSAYIVSKDFIPCHTENRQDLRYVYVAWKAKFEWKMVDETVVVPDRWILIYSRNYTDGIQREHSVYVTKHEFNSFEVGSRYPHLEVAETKN